jgi:protein required for attachment to host cells
MNRTFILVADAHRARCFERESANRPLVEQADFVLPNATHPKSGGRGDLTGDVGKGHGRTGHAGTQFEPKIELRDKERGKFARELANYLNTSAEEHQYQNLILIGTGPILGDIKPLLNTTASRALSRTVSKDLTHYTGLELQEHVNLALE